ncbi:MAG: phosphopyruvate hydratase, partial [Christensenellaceae bacterium]|nr:phosphopyruvate hydratase [Christensenellaceae bacterium]
DDFAGFSELTKKTGVQTVGDDLFVTDTERIKKGIENSSARAVLIKPNQIGSVMEACAAVRLAKEAGLGAIISHRSGDTEDSFIADMCVGLGAGQIKTGAPARAERTAKYSRLLFIEHELGKNAVFAGKKAINSVKWLDTEHAKL